MGSGRVEASPERGRPAYASRPAPARPMRKVQIVYYLCRNGQLEHPHFMELAQHPHQPLRLKGNSPHILESTTLRTYLHCVTIPRMMNYSYSIRMLMLQIFVKM
jgi:hypothetical protein